MKKSFKILSCCLILTFCAELTAGGQYEIKKSVIANGGGESSGGQYQVNGTIGQIDASNPMTGPEYAISGGFWSSNTPNDIIFKNGFE